MYCGDMITHKLIHEAHFICQPCLNSYKAYLQKEKMETDFVKCPARGCMFHFFTDSLF